MKNWKLGNLLIMATIIQSCATGSSNKPSDDPFLWLEEVEGAKALEWVNAHNSISTSRFKADPRFAGVHADLSKIAFAKDRIPSIEIEYGHVFNFWQDSEHVQGIWRMTTLASYETAAPKWTTLLDIDALSKTENIQWVFKGATGLAPEGDRYLISLSRGGKDAVEVREFDFKTRTFVKDGFFVPESKSWVRWKDKDTIWIGTDFGPGSMTTSGYPRISKLWKRGTKLIEAKTVFEGNESDVSVTGYTIDRPEGSIDLVERSPTFFGLETYLYSDGNLSKIEMPTHAQFQGAFHDHLFFILRGDWTSGTTLFKAGSLISVSLEKKISTLVMEKPKDGRILGVVLSAHKAFIQTLENIQSKLYVLDGIHPKAIETSFPGSVFHFSSASRWDDVLVIQAEDFLLPLSQYLLDESGKSKLLKKMPDRFDATPYVSEQRFATSKDGTRVPFFVVHAKSMKWDGVQPTLLNAYGGFEADHLPSYSGGVGKIWLERGGVYVRANIRGGGEYGPEWHTSAMKENRQRAFDDFFAVSEELIKLKITTPAHLGIMGGSNGGLLMGVALTQRPDLYGAIVCQVPLLDMLRYHHLLAGASWMDEYGNPDIPEQRAYIEKYSPYQNLKSDQTYPETYFSTSTKDDRVHPGHARKMVAKLESLNKPVLYFENTAGGHGGGANIEDHVNRWSYEFIYLMQKLFPQAR
jgi:prolyl oligopeptidase